MLPAAKSEFSASWYNERIVFGMFTINNPAAGGHNPKTITMLMMQILNYRRINCTHENIRMIKQDKFILVSLYKSLPHKVTYDNKFVR